MAAAVMAVLALSVLTSCGPKKNTALSRHYQAFITKYNIHYNGDTHFRETLKDMEDKYEDDYSQTLLIHPAEAKANPKAPQPSGNFDRSIEKAQKAIQLRSIKKKPKKQAGKSSDPKYKAWMKRDEYNPFLHKSWMLMAESQYMNGDFLGAASTFFYISKHFIWLPATVTEAQLWEALSYCAMDWLYEAETILKRVKEEQLTSKTLQRLYYMAQADLHARRAEYAEAIAPLEKAIKLSSGIQKHRLRFMLGQMYTRVGQKELAYKAFKQIGNSSSVSYRTKFNARIKQSEVFSGNNIEPEVKALKRMTRYDRNKDYLDQVYYAIGNLYLSRGDTTEAISNYALAAEKSTRSGIDKALAQVTLGGLYYDRHQYDKAQPCYAEALPLLPDNFPDYRMLKRRSDVLDELAVYSQNVELQDSLLELSAMTPEERLAVVEKIIEELKKREKEEAQAAAREEFEANRSANEGNQLQGSAAAPQSFVMNNGDDSWYFYNTQVKNNGRQEFQRIWGSRKLEDDWRRRNKNTFSFNDFDTPSDQDKEGEEGSEDENLAANSAENDSVKAAAADKASDPHEPEYYLRQIPTTPEEIQSSNEIVQEGLYNMGVILKDKLDDYPASEHEFNELLRRYPDNIYRLDVYYNLYLMFMRMGDTAKAERYRQLILSDFAESSYGVAMQNPDYIGGLRRMLQMENKLYDRQLQAYFNNHNDSVHAIYRQVAKEMPLTKLMPRFMFLEALAHVTDRNTEAFTSMLRDMLERYPDTDLSLYASSYLKGLAQGRELQKPTSNMRGMLWDIKLGNDSTATGDGNHLEFDLNPDEEQLFILLYPTEEVASNWLLYEVARHNFSSFVVKDFDLELMNFGRLGLLIVHGFDNVPEINHYRKVLAKSATLELPESVRPVVISAKNFDTLLKNGRSFEEYFNYVKDKTYRDTEESVLPPEFYGPSEGITSESSEPSESSESSDSSESSEPSLSPDNQPTNEQL